CRSPATAAFGALVRRNGSSQFRTETGEAHLIDHPLRGFRRDFRWLRLLGSGMRTKGRRRSRHVALPVKWPVESDGRSSFPQVAVSRPTMKSGLRPKISPDALSYLPPVLGQNARHRTTLSDSRSASDSSPSLRTTSALARTASLWMRADKPR